MQVCRGEGWYGYRQAMFKVNILSEEEQQQKAKLQKLFKQIFVVRLFSLNDFDFCMENLHAKEPCHDRLRPYSISSLLNSLSGCTKQAKVSCR